MSVNREFLETLDVARKKILSYYRIDERQCLKDLLKDGMPDPTELQQIDNLAKELVHAIRENNQNLSGFNALLSEYDLSNSEGVALMCLAEAILRIPDNETIEKLIADKLSHADWSEHIGRNKSKFVNSTTWSLFLTGKLLNLSGVLTSLIKRCGEPIVRQAVSRSVKLLCKQFVLGQTIDEGLKSASLFEASGYRFSYDMLGEEARTALDAQKYYERYLQAIEAIGKNAKGKDIYSNPSISIKLSALHPRFEWRKRKRVMQELLPRICELAYTAKQWNIGLTIDAEEAERFDLTLDVFIGLCSDVRFANWNGLGIALQAYQKRAIPALDYLIAFARKTKRRLNVRLVKGAYWDTEIKITQEKGLCGYPVYTRKVATDVAYIGCVKKMLSATDAIYPQFATHNAYSVAAVMTLAKEYNDFEFQILNGMGGQLSALIMQRYAIPCRIYAPVGNYSYLFGYLVRRLLENGANNSFVNRILDESISDAKLAENPYALLDHLPVIANPKIPLPKDLYFDRPNSSGIDFTNPLEYVPILEDLEHKAKTYQKKDVVHTTTKELELALQTAKKAANVWGKTQVALRAKHIRKMAELLEQMRLDLVALLVLEGNKTILDAASELREAIDYCWYYALQAEQDLKLQELTGPTGEDNQFQLFPRGVILCISPWNFPLAIFLGQIIAALVAGNTVIAKPAGQTPRISMFAIDLLHKAGIPKEVVQLVIGSGSEIGDILVKDLRVNGVMLTGSTATAWHINRNLASREGPIVPLIAETGGQNVMLVDSSALPEQVVQDIVISAFGSSGQRCSCLRVLYVQEDIAEVIITMLCGAMAQLMVDSPLMLATDIGPVIDRDAYIKLQAHKQNLTKNAKLLFEVPLTPILEAQNYFPPCAFEIKSISELKEEVFGPILHVVKYKASELSKVLNDINATGYGLTMGIHSRIDDHVDYIISQVKVGNIYINRNMIGAVVGVQPFGGEGLSGTGPKAGGPNYIQRLTVERSISTNTAAVGGNASLLIMDD